MRETYDCLILGLGPAACVAAKSLALAGRKVAMLPEEEEDAGPHDVWIVPAPPAESASLERLELGPSTLATQCRAITFATVGLDAPDPTLHSPPLGLLPVAEFRKHCRAIVEQDSRIEILSERTIADFVQGPQAMAVVTQGVGLEARELEATSILDARPFRLRRLQGGEGGRFAAHFWGVYENVAGIADGRAWRYFSQHAEFWLLPLAGRLETLVGVSVHRQTAARIASGADLWEDELVRCPELAERLMNAHLSDLHPQEYCVYPHRLTPPAAGIRLLAEISCPAASCFRWESLASAVEIARQIVAESAPSPSLPNG